MAKRLCKNLVRIVTAAYLVAHFSLSLLFSGPLNPLKVRYLRLAYATIGTYFPQNWSLFGPDPVASNQTLLVRCLNTSEARLDELPTVGWYDVSSPLVRRHQQNRFSAYDRLNRAQSSALRSLLGGDIGGRPLLQACRGGSSDACRAYSAYFERQKSHARSILARIGSSVCSQISFGTDQVAVRLREHAPVPWSKRTQGFRPRVRDYDIGRFALVRNIVPFKVFTHY